MRPVAHFVPRRGWVNDPYGVRWDGSRYHMCYQAVPSRTVWSPDCAWGHAVSDDLVTWEERPLVLAPQAYELGCWSGCVVDDDTGAPRAFYTRVRADCPELGSIAVARCDGSGRFVPEREEIVSGPPEGMRLATFRDPYAWGDPAGWTMIVGAGTADGAGAVLQYRSEDLERWTYTGVLCRGHTSPGREVWECPQMIEVGDAWLLIVSTQVEGQGGHVAAALGSYDGSRFHPEGWQRLAFGPAPYATSAFRDRDGRPCMISWLREDPEREASVDGWAGAESLVSELAIDPAGRLAVAPHSGLARSRVLARHEPAAGPYVHDLAAADPARATRLVLAPDAPFQAELRRREQLLASVTRSATCSGLTVMLPGRTIDTIPCRGRPGPVELFIDADILEIYSGGTYGAWRLIDVQAPPGPS